MTVIIEDLLKLPLFSEAKLMTGRNGIKREIKRLNFNDCPLDNESDQALTMQGDFFINSLYLVKDDIASLEKWFEFFIQMNVAGMCLINEYFQDLPSNIKSKLDKKNFPVILVDRNVPYAEIIEQVSELLFLEKTDTISKMQIDQLLNSDLSTQQVLEYASNINSVFRKNYACIFLAHNNDSKKTIKLIRNELSTNHNIQISKYNESLLVIVNFDDYVIYDSTRSFIRQVLIKHGSNYKMGVSNVHRNKNEFHTCLQEAISAFEYSQEININKVQYSDMEVYKLLMLINNPEYLKDFYQKFIKPLQTKDQTDLLETLEMFIEFDGDNKKTAKFFDQHENTVRYRISKAKKILNLEHNHLKFIEIVSIGLKIKHIFEDLHENGIYSQ